MKNERHPGYSCSRRRFDPFGSARKRSRFLITLLLACAALPAQWGETEQFPPGLEWQQIVIPGYRIIFPAAITADARRVAQLLVSLAPVAGRSLAAKAEPIDLILNNQTLMANGYVALAPRKAEWFTTPPQYLFSGAVDWYRLLAVHEGRHVLQFDRVNRGAVRWISSWFGELGQATITFLVVPTWFFEGDAVASETALTTGGRGRMPSFDLPGRAHILAGRRFSFAKAYLGSYKDVYLDPYSLGYLLAAYGRRRYGAALWGQVLDTAVDNAERLWGAFDFALRRNTGQNAAGLYVEATGFLAGQWRRQQEQLQLKPAVAFSTRRARAWTSYAGAACEAKGSVLAVKYGLADPPTLVRLQREGAEAVIRQFSPADVESTRLTLGGGNVVWSERIPDPRWSKRDRSAVVLFNVEKGWTRRLVRRGRLLNPALSPDGRSIAAVEYAIDNRCSLLLLSAADGRELRRFANPDNDYLISPAWSGDGRSIAFIRQCAAGVALAHVDLQSGLQRDLIPPGSEVPAQPAFCGRYILYSSPASGIDNIHAVDCETGQRFQVTSVALGAFWPAVAAAGDRLVFSTYTPEGLRIAEMELDPAAWIPHERLVNVGVQFYEPLVRQEQGEPAAPAEGDAGAAFTVKDYAPGRHLLNVHSWGLTRTDFGFGLHVLSSDVMNLSQLQAVFGYDVNERSFRLDLTASYRRLWPIIDLSLGYGGRRDVFRDVNGIVSKDRFTEAGARIGLKIPLDLSRGNFQTVLEFASGFAAVCISGRSADNTDSAGNGWHLPISYRFSGYHHRRGSSRDILPPLGLDVSLDYRHTPLRGGRLSSLAAIRAMSFFPGLDMHHGLRLRLDYQRLERGDYPFASLVSLPRGYDWQLQDRVLRLAADYAFPLAYPDWAAGKVLYLKRVRMDIFYDHALGNFQDRASSFSSAGIEILADCHLFQIVVPLEIGARLSYRFADRSVRFEPLVFTLPLPF